MEDIPAVRLKIEALTGRVCRDQNAERMFGRIGVEGSLNDLALADRGRTMEDCDALLCSIGAEVCGRELLLKVPLGIVVFREEDDADVVPLGAWRGESRAHVLLDPLDQLHDLASGNARLDFGQFSHLLQESLLLGKEFTSGLRIGRSGRGGSHRGDFCFLFKSQFSFRKQCPVIIRANTAA